LERRLTTRSSAHARICSDQSGAVFLELLICIIPMWTFFLCLVQLALIAHASLMVRHAADSAARSAVVVLPDDPDEYAGEPKMTVSRNPLVVDDVAVALNRLSSFLRDPSPHSIAGAFSERALANLGRSRLNTIRLAAHVPLMPLSPTRGGRVSHASIRNAIGGEGALLAAFYYQPLAVAVTFPGLNGEVVTEPEITVRVTYAYQCMVPLARRILCRAFSDLQAKEELRDVFLPVAQSLLGGRYRSLQHETTLMIHDTSYLYRARGT
jgi:hypothetical protein